VWFLDSRASCRAAPAGYTHDCGFLILQEQCLLFSEVGNFLKTHIY
jgi:hypothetical protein